MLAQKRMSIFEPLAVIATVSLLASWGIQPFLAEALASRGVLAQQTAHSALWISAVLSPFAAFGKALAGALIAWAIATFLNERLSLIKLVSVFCAAETVFCLRDLATWATLAIRGVSGIHSAADLAVPFGLNAFIQAHTVAARIATSSWDFFHVAWALLVFVLIRSTLRTEVRSSACLAASALAFRVLFAAATLVSGV